MIKETKVKEKVKKIKRAFSHGSSQEQSEKLKVLKWLVSKVKEKVKKIKKAFSHDSSQEQSKKLKALKWRWSLCQKPSATRCDAWWKARIYYFKKKKLLDNNERSSQLTWKFKLPFSFCWSFWKGRHSLHWKTISQLFLILLVQWLGQAEGYLICK